MITPLQAFEVLLPKFMQAVVTDLVGREAKGARLPIPPAFIRVDPDLRCRWFPINDAGQSDTACNNTEPP